MITLTCYSCGADNAYRHNVEGNTDCHTCGRPFPGIKVEGDEPLSNMQLVQQMLRAIGENPNREGLRETPRRVSEAWKHLFSGYSAGVQDIFTTFEEDHDEMVIVKSIEFYSHCEHHVAPFFGTAHVGYIPAKRIVGLSKLARLVEIFARRLQVQERLGAQVADALMEFLKPQGCGVVLEAQHLCMMSRGVEKQGSTTMTSSMRGSFLKDAAIRAEFLSMIKG